ncbi:MAG: hypothetical protein JOZ47_21300 [Kutzneria sp.]|nr:hypothetical protein [Kutzneria sp.]
MGKMADAWRNRTPRSAGYDKMPSAPAGALQLDEIYLEALSGGAADSVDEAISFDCHIDPPGGRTNPTAWTCCA